MIVKDKVFCFREKIFKTEDEYEKCELCYRLKISNMCLTNKTYIIDKYDEELKIELRRLKLDSL